MGLSKLFNRVNWNKNTSMSPSNFNKADKGLDDIDNRLVTYGDKVDTLESTVSSLNNNIASKANMHREGYTEAPDIYIENRSALVIFGKQQYSQSSLLYYDSLAKKVQPLVNPSSDTFTVTILSDGRVKITAAKAKYSNKAAIYMN